MARVTPMILAFSGWFAKVWSRNAEEFVEQMAWVKDNRALYEAVLKRDYLTPQLKPH